jgi:hypothetical protein
MHRPTVPLLLLACSQLAIVAHFCAISAFAADPAQAPSAAPPAQSATKAPAPTSAASPSAIPPSTPSATSVATSAETSPVTTDSAATVAPTSSDKPKKIWTNEDVSGMKGTISVVGDGRNSKAKNAAQTPADPQYIANVRKQIEKFQEQMADADKELAGLKNFSEGEPVATPDRELHKSYNSQPVDQQITNLQTKKKDLQSKIDALLDEARKKGVEPGQLR